jgi:phage anti-repressor protein
MVSTQTQVAIRETVIGSVAVPSVMARELHRAIGSKRQFSNWINDRIEKYGFVQGVDYITFRDNTGPQHITTKEYILSIDMAKELAMVEQTGQGKVVRRYFIDMEKRYLSGTAAGMLAGPAATHDGPGYPRVTSLDLERLERCIADIKGCLPPINRSAVARKIWGDIWQIAGGRRENRRLLPSERMPLYLSYLADKALAKVESAPQPKVLPRTTTDLPLSEVARQANMSLDALEAVLCETHVCSGPGVLSRSYSGGSLFRYAPDRSIIITRRGQIWLAELLAGRQEAKQMQSRQLVLIEA